MGAPPTWTQADTDRLTQLHGEGHSLGHIASVMGRPKSTLSGKAKAAGLVWDRANTATATKAKVDDAKARKAAALLVELEILERSQQRVVKTLRGKAKWDALVKATGGAEHAEQLSFIPSREMREEAATRAQSATIIDRLADKADDRDLPAVDAWLAHITGGPKVTQPESD